MSWEKSVIRFTERILLGLLAGSAVASQGAAAELVPELHAAEAISEEAAATAVREAFAYNNEPGSLGSDSGRAKSAQTIEVDLSLLSADPDQLRVALPDGRVFVASRNVSWTEDGDRRYWSGELHPTGDLEKEAAGTLTLSAEGGIVAGWLRAGGVSFEIVPLEEGRQQLVPVVASAGADGAAAGSSCATLSAHDEEVAHDEPLRPVGVDADPPASVVDVLVIFPRSLAATPTQLMQTRAKINLWFGDANQVLANSRVNHRFRALYSGALQGPQPPVATSQSEPSTVLGVHWLDRDQSEVVALRDSWKADLVALFVPADGHVTCGNAQPDEPAKAEYAAIDLGCFAGEYLVAHELGHLLGMRHSKEGDDPRDPRSPFTYGYGYDNRNQLMIDNERAATVLACNGDNNGAHNPTQVGNQCNRIPYYSSPEITVGGVVIGTSVANNARVAKQQMYLTAQRRPSVTIPVNTSPQVTLVRPVGTVAQSFEYLTLSAGAFDREDGDLSANVRWTSNRRGTLGTGPNLRIYSNLQGNEILTVSVTDSGGLTQSQSIALSFVPRVTTAGAIWHAPGTPGRFLSFNQNVNDDWIATWMTYEGSNPVWYLSGVAPVSANGSFTHQLLRHTRNTTTGQQTTATFGVIAISVETERQIRVKITPVSGPVVDLMLEPYTLASPGPGGYVTTLANGQVDPGWVIFRGSTTQGEYSQAVFVAAFDGALPVWVLGLDTPISPSHNFRLDMHRPTPTTLADNWRLATAPKVGYLVLSPSNTALFQAQFPSLNTWLRPHQPMEPFVVR